MKKEELVELQEQEIQRREQTIYALLRDGKLTEEQVRIHAIQWYFHTVGFVQAMKELCARCPWPDVRSYLAESLYEEESGRITGTAPHLELYFQYAKSWGYDPDMLMKKVSILPEMAAIVNWYYYAPVHLGSLVGLTVLNIAAEGLNVPRGGKEGASRLMADALQKHYGLSKDDVLFFDVHAEADVEHSEVGINAVAKYAVTEEDRAKVYEAFRITTQLHRAFGASLSRYKLNDCFQGQSALFYF
jgi:pyrroloquinoline quinone (PQQ) biosynthesis protein C